jgi:molybdenum-dependent DNA-binding transcriptional regulator ModE
MNLDLGSLRSVIAAAEHGSFRQAATALNLKQSALSRRIRHLEDQVGVSLFERSSGGVRLTPAGESMAHAARRLFEEIDDMIKASQLAGRGKTGVLKAGFGTAVSDQQGTHGPGRSHQVISRNRHTGYRTISDSANNCTRIGRCGHRHHCRRGTAT